MIINSSPSKFLAGWAHRNAIAAYREHQEKTMTNAIEQSKREMYRRISYVRRNPSASGYYVNNECIDAMEESLEAYLELLRQDHEALHETARKRFEDIQSLEAVNAELQISLENFKTYNSRQAVTIGSADEEIADLEGRLAKVIEERDLLRNRQQASEHACSEQQSKLHPCMVEEKGLQDDWDAEFKCDSGKPRKCLHDDCKARKEAIATMARENGDRASCAALDGKTAAILGAVVDCQRITTSWAIGDLRAKTAIRAISAAVNGSPRVIQAMMAFEDPKEPYGCWFINNGGGIGDGN